MFCSPQDGKKRVPREESNAIDSYFPRMYLHSIGLIIMQASFSFSQLYNDAHSTDWLPPLKPQRQVSSGEYNGCNCYRKSTTEPSFRVAPRNPWSTSEYCHSSPIPAVSESSHNASSFFPSYSSSIHTSDSVSVLSVTSTDPSSTSEHTISGETRAVGPRKSLFDDDDLTDDENDGFLRRHFDLQDDHNEDRITDHRDGHRWVHSSGISDPSSSSEWTMPLQPQRRSSLCSGII